MSLKIWCPDCDTQTVLGVVSIADGDEFTCDDCKRVFFVRIERGLTPLALDGGDSAASEQLSTPEVLSTLQGESTPAHRK